MIPVVVIVGRPNVGKSTLFNVLTRTRNALVYDMPEVTRDRKYGEVIFEKKSFILIDTAGLSEKIKGLNGHMKIQSKQAIDEANLVYFVVDARVGLTVDDCYIANYLRACNKSTFLVINKTDGLQEELISSDFYSLGFKQLFSISAVHKRGILSLLSQTLSSLDKKLIPSKEGGINIQKDKNSINFSIIGRPNTGKSTLSNCILGEDRSIVYDMPGTTIDSVYTPFSRNNEHYVIIDTAGVRRRGKVKETLEKFSVIKTLQAIKDSNVVVILIDAKVGITDQDVNLVGLTLHAGRPIVIGINKWDNMAQSMKDCIKSEINRRLEFLKGYVSVHFISALHGTNVRNLFRSINNAYKSSIKKISTPELTKALKLATANHLPPVYGRYRIKLKYAHMGGINPPTIVIHGNKTDQLSESYKRYLENFFRQAFNLLGTPIILEFKQTKNPYKTFTQSLCKKKPSKV